MIWSDINFDELHWYKFTSNLDKYGTIGYAEEILKDMDVSKGIYTTDSFMYKELIDTFYRIINRIPDFTLYNNFVTKCLEQHERNIEYEKQRKTIKTNEEVKRTKRNKRISKQIIHHTHDLFDNSDIYIVDDMSNGTSKYYKILDGIVKEVPKKKKYDKTKKFIGVRFDFTKLKK